MIQQPVPHRTVSLTLKSFLFSAHSGVHTGKNQSFPTFSFSPPPLQPLLSLPKKAKNSGCPDTVDTNGMTPMSAHKTRGGYVHYWHPPMIFRSGAGFCAKNLTFNLGWLYQGAFVHEDNLSVPPTALHGSLWQ